MKKNALIYSILATFMFLTSCGSDNDGFDPYKAQEKHPFYPTALTFRSSNSNTEITENWTFEYDEEYRISNYTYEKSIKGSDREIVETSTGNLRYFTDFDNRQRINTNITSEYTSTKQGQTINYTENLKEDVRFDGNLIASIETTGERNTKGVIENISTERTFSYAKEYCTGSIYRDNSNNEQTYTYQWDNTLLKGVTIYKQNGNNSETTNDSYRYSYNTREVADDYGFNPLAFVYGHNPEIYAAMGYFGKVTPFVIEQEKYESYDKINNEKYPTQSETHEYIIQTTNNSLSFTADPSEAYDEYQYTFRK